MPDAFRIFPERRTGKDRNKIFNLLRFFYNGPERRKALQDRRSQEERRDGWVININNIIITGKHRFNLEQRWC